MQLLSVKEACSLINTADMTIRNWVEEGKLTKHEDEKGRLLIDKRELLKQTPTIISLYNYKGGVGKTTSALLLTDYFSQNKDEKILICDFDPQANLSLAFFDFEQMIIDGKYRLSLYDYFNNRTPLSKMVMSYSDSIDVLPSRLELGEKANIDSIDLLSLKKDFVSLFKKYTIVIVDCPPALNSLSRLGMLLANYIFIPVIPEPFSYFGLGSMLESIKKIIPYNQDYIGHKVFISIHKSHRTIIREDYIDSIKSQLNNNVFENTIPDYIGIVERGTIRENIFDLYKNERAIDRVAELMQEIDTYIYDER